MYNRRTPKSEQAWLSAEAKLESVLKFWWFEEKLQAIKADKKLAKKVWKERLINDITIPERMKHFLSFCITNNYDYSTRW